MRCDDGRCHICRREPLRQSRLYRFTTCEDCDETARARGPVGFWQSIANWLGSRW